MNKPILWNLWRSGFHPAHQGAPDTHLPKQQIEESCINSLSQDVFYHTQKLSHAHQYAALNLAWKHVWNEKVWDVCNWDVMKSFKPNEFNETPALRPSLLPFLHSPEWETFLKRHIRTLWRDVCACEDTSQSPVCVCMWEYLHLTIYPALHPPQEQCIRSVHKLNKDLRWKTRSRFLG